MQPDLYLILFSLVVVFGAGYVFAMRKYIKISIKERITKFSQLAKTVDITLDMLNHNKVVEAKAWLKELRELL